MLNKLWIFRFWRCNHIYRTTCCFVFFVFGARCALRKINILCSPMTIRLELRMSWNGFGCVLSFTYTNVRICGNEDSEQPGMETWGQFLLSQEEGRFMHSICLKWKDVTHKSAFFTCSYQSIIIKITNLCLTIIPRNYVKELVVGRKNGEALQWQYPSSY